MKADTALEEEVSFNVNGDWNHDENMITDFMLDSMFKVPSELEFMQNEDVLIKHLKSALHEMDFL